MTSGPPSSADLDDLLARARRAFGELPPGKAIGDQRAIVLTDFPKSERMATQALALLLKGEAPALEEREALDRMIRLMRPAPLSNNSRLDALPSYNHYPPQFEKHWNDFRRMVAPLLYSVGRIDRSGNPTGSGFVVGPGLLLTNKHVASEICKESPGWPDGVVHVNFRQESETRDGDTPSVPVVGVVALHATLDLALLQLAQSDRSPATIERSQVEKGHPVAAVGYPFEDGRNVTSFMEVIFQGSYGVKRAAPGEVIGLAPHTLYHDCSTLGGNSGSPVFSMRTGRVVGVHCGGDFLTRNEAVDGHATAEFVQAHLH